MYSSVYYARRGGVVMTFYANRVRDAKPSAMGNRRADNTTVSEGGHGVRRGEEKVLRKAAACTFYNNMYYIDTNKHNGNSRGVRAAFSERNRTKSGARSNY